MKEKEHLKIERKAQDNKYLHRDFHITADIGIAYVGELFGDEGVKEYLTQYAKSAHKLLAEEVKKDGLNALRGYFENIYLAEERPEYISAEADENSLRIRISRCPAIEFMKENGHQPTKWYGQTVTTVYPVLAEMCGLKFELKRYDDQTGAAEFLFKK